MKRFITIIISTILVFSLASISFASDNPTVKAPIIVKGQDYFFEIDDMGIYDLIYTIDDPIKKEKIAKYWYEPAYIIELRGDGNSILYAGYAPYNSHIWSGPY